MQNIWQILHFVCMMQKDLQPYYYDKNDYNYSAKILALPAN